MYSSIRIKTFLVSIIISFIILFQCILTVPIIADPNDGEITLYFKDAINLDGSNEYDSVMGLSVLVSEDLPNKNNDSTYPPRIMKGLDFNDEEWIFWFSSWIFYFMNSNESIFGDEYDEYLDLFEGFELYLPHPFRIVESFENYGNQPLQLDGDINFDLYFSTIPFSNLIKNDEVKVGLYTINSQALLPLPQQVKNSTAEIKIDKFGRDIINQEININDVNLTLDPGELLLFQIEIVPSNKSVIEFIKKDRPLVKQMSQIIFDALIRWINQSTNPNLIEIDQFINEVIATANDLNVSFTASDAADIINSLISSYFVYDSTNHPSSVTLPIISSLDELKSTVIYYLHSNNSMDENQPTNNSPTSINLAENSGKWKGHNLERNKILNDASAKIYIKYNDLRFLKENIAINANLIYNNEVISSSTVELEKTNILDLTSPTESVIIFPFSNLDNIEIEYDSNLELSILVGNNTDFGRGLFRSLKILYDSEDYSSLLRLKFNETDHIKMDISSSPINEKVVPGGSVTYTIDLSSEKEDDIVELKTNTTGNEKWTLTFNKNEIPISKGGTESAILTVTSSTSVLDGDIIRFMITSTGKTGYDTYETYVEVSEQAVEYNINVTKPNNKTIRHGENGTYYFKIENLNTGIWPDSYDIEIDSEHNWTLEYDELINDLLPGEEQELKVKIFVPKNTNVSSDILTIRITSINNPETSTSFVVKTKIIGPNLLEQIYSFFESAAEDLGLDDIFGDYAPHFLIALIFVIIFFIIIILVALIISKSVKILCIERIKEISPNEEARFEITLQNPTKKMHKYHLSASNKPGTNKWLLSLDQKFISLEPSGSRLVYLTVKSTENVESGDWIQIGFIVKTEGKKKLEKITTMTMIKEVKSNISIDDISHWPRSFSEDDKVTTSFKIKNNGNVQVKSNVILTINGKENNKLENIVIPAGGYGEIKMPWIAVKGKNEINIIVK